MVDFALSLLQLFSVILFWLMPDSFTHQGKTSGEEMFILQLYNTSQGAWDYGKQIKKFPFLSNMILEN